MNPPRLIPLLLVLLALMVVPAPRAAADAYDTMRVNWFNSLTGGTAYDASDPDVAAATTSLTNSANADWTLLKNAQPFATSKKCFNDISLGSNSANLTTTYSRLQTMAAAYWAIGGALYQNAALRADIISALDWLNANVYNPSITNQYGNWFDWQIGTPLNLTNTVVLLYDSLSTTQTANYVAAIEHFRPDTTVGGSISGANSAWAATILGLCGVVNKDANTLALASSTFSTLTAYVTAGDGFYTDGSNIGHGYFSYTGGYGLYMLQELAAGYYLFNPSALDPLPTAQRATAYNWVFDSYQSLMYQGKIPYYAIGREISRGPSDGRGEGVASVIVQLVGSDNSADAKQLLAFAKNVFAAGGTNYGTFGSIGTVIAMKSLMSNAAVTASAQPLKSTIFPVMDKETTLQNGWSTSLSYYSSRTHNYESINGENLQGWHLSDGLLYLENADWNQYNGNFWATVNSYRLPGTTVTANTSIAEGLANGSPFAGGATLNDLYATVGFTLQPGHGQTLVANKSWFIFDDEVVCLGSGITSTDGKPVETIVENRKLASDGANPLTINGAVQPTSLPWTATQSVQWMHLAGTVTGSDIGYYFPSAANLDFTREARTSSWSALDTTKSTTPVTDNYLTVGNSHGTNPTAATYAYILLPNYSAAQVAAYATAPTASILENDAQVSAVYHSRLKASGIVFWQDQASQVQIDTVPTTISSDRKAVVMTQDAGSQFSVAVSDPTQANSGTISVAISRPFVSVASADSAIKVTQLSPTLRMTVAVAGAKGQTFHAVFNEAPATVAPQITVAGNASGTVGQAFSYQIVASNSPTGFAATGLPPGLSLAATSGVIAGTPTTSGSFNIELAATNAGGTSTATLVTTIAPQAVLAPQMTSATTTISLGQAYSYQIAASNSPASYSATGLPAGLTLATATGLISGTPATVGSYSVILGATNAGGTGTATLTLNVVNPLPTVSIQATTPIAVVGDDAPGTFTVSRTGDTSTSLTVYYEIKGSGTNGVDYLALNTHTKIKAGQSSRTVRVTPIGDMGGANKRTVKLNLVGNTAYVLGAVSSAKMKLEPADKNVSDTE